MAPAPTPPPPMVHLTPRNKGKHSKRRKDRDQYKSRSDNSLEGQDSKRKKKKKKLHSPSEGAIFTTHSSGETIDLMNGRPNGKVNGHISYMEKGSLPKTLPPLSHGVPAFSSSSSLADDNDDTQDLQAAIKEAQRMRAQEEGVAPAGGGNRSSIPPAPGVPGTYNPVSSGHFEVTASPRLVIPIPPPPVLPSGPAREYHSDSAESLQEVPLSSGRSGYSGRTLTTRSSSRLPPLHSSRSGKRKGAKRRSPSTEDVLTGSVRLSSLRGLPVTHLGPTSPRNVIPPLDLASLNGDSDDEVQKPNGRLKKKSRHKQQVSKI